MDPSEAGKNDQRSTVIEMSTFQGNEVNSGLKSTWVTFDNGDLLPTRITFLQTFISPVFIFTYLHDKDTVVCTDKFNNFTFIKFFIPS